MENSQTLYLNLFSEDKAHVLKELLHSCVDEICGRPGPSYHRFVNSMDWSKEEYEEAYRLFSLLLRNPSCLYLSQEKMPQDYHELPEHVQQNLLECLQIRREQVVEALVKENLKNERETVTDFDWRLKMVMGSSKVATLKEPLVQLDLVVEDKHSRRVLNLELDTEELDTFIGALESIKQ